MVPSGIRLEALNIVSKLYEIEHFFYFGVVFYFG